VNVRRGPSTPVLAAVVFVAVALGALFAGPFLVLRWRSAEAQAEAETAYLHRQAELRAESEAAEKNLDLMDRRVKLVSLGFREVARKVAPKVVNVSNEKEVPLDAAHQFAKKPLFYDSRKDKVYMEVGVGSGIIVKPGLVLTNNHVVKGAERLRVTFASGQWVTVGAESLAADPVTDLAVIRLPADPGPGLRQDQDVTTEFADSDKDVQVGDWCLAVGSPLGLKQTVTAGIISAKGRLLGLLDLVELLQTDAAINPGNSGGPLFDQMGRLAGINVAIATETGVNQGIAFAIPSNTARDIFNQLVEKGEVVRGYVGIAMQDVPEDQVRRLGIGDTGGVVVGQVVPGQAADRAGIEVGDVIVRYNREPVGGGNPIKQLRKMVLETRPDTTVPVEIVRRGQRQTLEVTIGKRPAKLP
jgi:serine protease Do